MQITAKILSSVNKAMTVIPEKKCSLCQFGPQNVYVLILFSFVIFKGLDSVSFYASCPTFIFPSNWFLELNRRFKMSTDQESSIHSKHIAEVHNVPISVLIRPFASVLDNVKVESLMKTIQVGYITTCSSCFHRRNQRFLCCYTGHAVLTDRKPVVFDDGSFDCYPYPYKVES